MDEDFLLAIQLQEQFDHEYQASLFSSKDFGDDGVIHSSKKRKVEGAGGGSDVVPYWKTNPQPERPLSIVDASWEMLDPSPDVRAMFLEFNDMFFWSKLCGVEVKWSPRMTLCAGVCSYEGRGGLCSIRLSEPLLKLRPRKDLVETLLHEMIHALLFVTQNNRDRDGHGPEFCKHMNRINKASGTNITIYHSFHDEVDVYRQHWWRCNGPCQNRRPYFGYVKRAMNRAPSSLDPWWEDHQRTCGGTYTKIKEPEGYGKKGKKDAKTSEKKTLGSGKPSSTIPGSGSQDIRNIIPFSGKGFILGGNSQNSTSSSPSPRPPLPAVKAPLSSPVPSPKKFFTPSSPPKSLSSPVLSTKTNGTSNTFPAIRPAASMGTKLPVKKSVSNTRVFVSINGSPVKIPKSHSSSRSQGEDKLKQKSIEDLFNSTSLRKPETKRDSPTSSKSFINAASASSIFPKQQNDQSTSSPNTPKPSPNIPNHCKYPSVVSTGSQGSISKPIPSKYSTNSDSDSAHGAAGGGQTSRKRVWGDRSSIADFFQKTSGSNSAASKESVKAKSPAMQVEATTTPSSSAFLQSSPGLHSVAASSSSSSSSAVMVSCPVCQAKVQESKINEHLDSCLS
ncbi:DNA-dependent metalloprotease SPRTN [Archocentrus centrarchus]|uniref:DNA-dependent metalloprotease SPRTN n=1 Tax=Archocentrus centrarchus TaxID=63155 RepID=UPI0011EA35EE|nr:sprT-like domain-containing protein Spartan [Archocentrus centrarchus]